MKKYFKAAGYILLLVVIYFALQFVYIIGAGIVLGIGIAAKNPGMDMAVMIAEIQNKLMPHIIISIIFAAIVSFLIFYAISRRRKEDIFEICRLSCLKFRTVLVLIVAGVGLFFFNGFLMDFIKKSGSLKEAFAKHDVYMGTLMEGNFVVVFLAVAIAAPLIEEVIFRGLILNELKKIMPTTLAVVIQGILFGLYHMQLIQGTYAILIGILLGFAYIWTKSIFAPIIIHVSLNGISVILSRVLADIEPSDTTTPYEYVMFAVSILLVVISFIYLKRNRVKENHGIIQEEKVALG